MRLPDFILANTEPILAEWEAFARSIWPRDDSDPEELRDHAADILRTTAMEMQAEQSSTERSEKSQGRGNSSEESDRMDSASAVHAVARLQSGFDLLAVIAEYRALRASVIRLWRDSKPAAASQDLDDLTRFNEAIDQSLTKAVRSYTHRADRSRKMFLGVLGHDLRNPLNAITMSAGLLSKTSNFDEEDADLLHQISSSASVMNHMVADLLDFTTTSLGGKIPLNHSEMDLARLCQEVAEEIQAVHGDCEVHIESNGNVTGSWDRQRLRQVVSNLLANAFQHGADAGPVTLSLRGGEAEVALSVHNVGEAIPQEDLPTLFDPLVRGTRPDANRLRQAGSVGLGLYIAREIVCAHGGKIEATSSEEEGTRFTACLPRQPS